MRKLMMVIAMGLVLTGCASQSGQPTESAPSAFVDNSVAQLSDTVGNPDQVRASAKLPRELALSAAKDYQAPTGKWFEEETGFDLLTSYSSDEVEAGSSVGAALRMIPTERSVRFQITSRDNEGNRLQQIEEYVADINNTLDGRPDYFTKIPERPNTNYLLSIEIVSPEGIVEDTKLIPIFVPANELNARLSVKQSTNGSDLPELTLNNAGPTVLYFGYGYEVYCQTADGWQLLPNDRAVPAIGISLQPGASHEETISFTRELEPGTYRVIKRFEGYMTDQSAGLAAEFEIE